MLLVFTFGCVIPLLLVYFYMYEKTRSSLLEQNIYAQKTGMEEERGLLEDAMNEADEFSSRIHFDNSSGKVVVDEGDGKILRYDYHDYELLEEYIERYYSEIVDVSVYLFDDSVKVDNRHYKLVTDTIRAKEWFKDTSAAEGQSIWSYLTNVQTLQRSLRLTRTITDEKGNEAGIVSVALSPELSETYIMTRPYQALMLLNDSNVVYSNFKITEEETADFINKVGTGEFGGNITFRDTEYITSKINIQADGADDYYSIIHMTPYQNLWTETKRSAVYLMLPFIVAIIIMAASVISLSAWYTRRITDINRAMKKITEKDYKHAETEVGAARDELWELYNDLQTMVADMQRMDEQSANERIEKEQLYARQREVEFKMLTTQVNPHFLYNTLENIRMLAAIHGEKEIEEISVDLTSLLRSSLEAGNNLRTLAWEMNIVECYIRIQNFRFGDRITAEIEYDKEQAEKYLVLPFIIQPFVENAYAHGMESKETGLIRVLVDIEDKIHITIEDNGDGMTEDQLEEIRRSMDDYENTDRSHIGICNVNQRIKLRFGEEYGVELNSKYKEGTKIDIWLPLQIQN